MFRVSLFTHVGRTFLLFNDRAIVAKFLWFVRCAICLLTLLFFANVVVMVFYLVAVVGFRLQSFQLAAGQGAFQRTVRTSICP